jgi:ABC-type dipeptide/oligopeptide/nickel transport system ATPase component
VTEPAQAEAQGQKVLCHWDVPGVGAATPVRICATAGRSTTVVGANGSGKSALGLWMEQNNGGFSQIRRLIAHRRLWFRYAGPELTSAQRESTRTNVSAWSRQQDSRYLDHADGQRANMVLFDIVARMNHYNAQAVEMYGNGASHQEVEAQLGQQLLKRLNAIFQLAGLSLELRLTEEQTLNAVNTANGSEYPIFQMSDGEKSALLLAGEVLTTAEGSVYIIDEPERHLHRSISAGLVEAIIADRPDSHFVVLTHDLELAAALGDGASQVYSLTGCTWAGQNADGWQLFPADASAELPESARLAILGGRRELLFIEGEMHSLDMRLYKLLFPKWTLYPTGGCDQVIRAVTGLRTSESHHWLSARGVVDGDGRNEDEKSSLHARGILALPFNEVENLYYSDVVMRAVAARQAELVDESADGLTRQAAAVALRALGNDGTPERLATGLALSISRRRLVEAMPISINAAAESITVNVPSPYPELLLKITDLLRLADLDGLVRLLPVRDTALRAQVARALRFQNTSDYEAAARVRIRDDATLAAAVRALIGPMPS